jgi:hypothetical protein
MHWAWSVSRTFHLFSFLWISIIFILVSKLIHPSSSHWLSRQVLKTFFVFIQQNQACTCGAAMAHDITLPTQSHQTLPHPNKVSSQNFWESNFFVLLMNVLTVNWPVLKTGFFLPTSRIIYFHCLSPLEKTSLNILPSS